MNTDKLRAAWQIFNQAWKMLKTFSGLNDSDDDGWQRAIGEADRVCKNAADSGCGKLGKDICMATLSFLEDDSMERSRGRANS